MVDVLDVMKHYVTISESKNDPPRALNVVEAGLSGLPLHEQDTLWHQEEVHKKQEFNVPAMLSYQYQMSWADNVPPHKFGRKCQDRSMSGLREGSYTTFTQESVHPVWNQRSSVIFWTM